MEMLVLGTIMIWWVSGELSTHKRGPNVSDDNQEGKGQLPTLITCVVFEQTKDRITIIHNLLLNDDPDDNTPLWSSLADSLKLKL